MSAAPDPTSDTDPLTFAERRVKALAFIKLLLGGFIRHQGPQNAAALTFASLLSLVPLMAMSLAIFYAFPVADRVQQTIQDFLFANFVPTSGEVLQEHLQAFSAKASKLSGAGFAFLIVVALMMMNNIDRALNTIWEVKNTRRPMNQFLIYWSILTLGPLLIGVSVVATSYLVSLPFLSDAVHSGIGRNLLGLTPVIASTLAFSLMYAVIPNIRVRFVHALAGGFVAALLFEAAKRGFGFYVTTFPTYEAIYGAMATIPIFLVWVYLSWMVVLLGAEVTHCLRIFHWQKDDPKGRELGFSDAVRLLLLLDRAASRGDAMTVEDLIECEPVWREDYVDELLSDMQGWHWVHQTLDGKWVLARRMSDLTLHEVLMQGQYVLPKDGASDWPVDAQLARHLHAANAGVADVMGVPVSDFRLPDSRPPQG